MTKVISAREVTALLVEQGYEAIYDSELKTITIESEEFAIGPANDLDQLDYDLISYGFLDDDEDEEDEEICKMARIYDEAESGEFTAENLVKDIIDYLRGN